MSELISVVIPTYNHADYLKRALQSVIDQSYVNWEALVIDNNSQDGTREVLQSIDDPRVHVYSIQNEGVIAASRNMGISKARGDWVAFLDSDDFWYPEKLATAMGMVGLGDSDVISNDELMVNLDTGENMELHYGLNTTDCYRELLLEGNQLSPSATMVRRAFLTKHKIQFDESKDFITVEDYGLWLDLARYGARFSFTGMIMGEFSIHGANNSSRYILHRKNMESLLREHVFHRQTFEDSHARLWKQIVPRLHFMDVRNLLSDGEISQAIRLTLQDMIFAPLSTSTYIVSKIKRRLLAMVQQP